MRPLRLGALPLLLVAACQASPPPTPAGPTAGAIAFTKGAVGPVALGGGAVVADAGTGCPGGSPPYVRVVGAGLPAGTATLALTNGTGSPVPVRSAGIRQDGSFDETLALAPLPVNGRWTVAVTHDAAPGETAALPLPTCPPSPLPGTWGVTLPGMGP